MLRAENISFTYSPGMELIENLNFDVARGEFTGLIGPSGAGKTTVFRIISGYLTPLSGRVLLAGRDICDLSHRERSKRLAIVPQDIHSPMPYTVRQIVEMGRVSRLSRFRPPSREDREAVEEALSSVSMEAFSDRFFNHLSGGEKQKTLIATALAQTPEIILFDEPTSSLDIGQTYRLMEFLSNLNREKDISIVIISHDIQLAGNFCERLIVIRDGKIMADGSPRDVLDRELIKETYKCDVRIVTDEKGRRLLSPC